MEPYQVTKNHLLGLRQKTNREKPQPQSLLGIYFEKPKIAETQIDQGKFVARFCRISITST
ncbi:MAG: hypothetical protein GPJ19_12590 [Microcystis aeruginosa LG13-13]|nr:hypothetical protein [Microcystis aeruginosa LG13-13]